MTDTDELIAFVRRCLDAWERRFADDERVARAATSGPWRAEVSENGLAGDVEHVTSSRGEYFCCTAEDATHIARWDPVRVLAEVTFGRAAIAAKWRILDDIAGRLSPREDDGGWESADAETDGMASTTLRLLAQPFAGWDGWREEWHADVMPS